MSSDSESDLDAMLDEFEDESSNRFRESRAAFLKGKYHQTLKWKENGHGFLNKIQENEFLNSVTKSEYAVCHFRHPDFERCRIMDKQLELIAAAHLSVKFVSLDATEAPFFVTKLSIKVLPTLILFKEGIMFERMVGFEGLSGDDFKTEELDSFFLKHGIYNPLEGTF